MKNTLLKKVVKLEIHLGEEDRRKLDLVFSENKKLIELMYNVLKYWGRLEITNGRLSSKAPVRIRRLVKELAKMKGVRLSASTMELQIDKVWESFVATYKAHGRMPGEEIIESVSNILRVRVSKRASSGKFYKRQLTLQLMDGGIVSGTLSGIDGNKYFFLVSLSWLPIELKKAIKGEDGYTLGDPSELIRIGDRFFLHLVVEKEANFPKEIKRVVGIDLGISQYFLVALAYDLEEDEILGVLKVKSRDIVNLYRELKQLIRKQMRNQLRPEGGNNSHARKLIRRYKLRLLRLAKLGKPDKAGVYDYVRNLYGIERGTIITYDMLSNISYEGVRWRLPLYMNERRAKIMEEKRRRIVPRTALGKSKYKEISQMYVSSIVNSVVAFAKRYGCQAVVVENLRGLRNNIRRLRRESKKLGEKYLELLKQGKHDEARRVLREKERVDNLVFMLSNFPYRKFLEDLETETKWNNMRFIVVSPKGTSITCPRCGYMDKGNRPNRSTFECRNCGYRDHADFVAAINIARKVKGIRKP